VLFVYDITTGERRHLASQNYRTVEKGWYYDHINGASAALVMLYLLPTTQLFFFSDQLIFV